MIKELEVRAEEQAKQEKEAQTLALLLEIRDLLKPKETNESDTIST